MFNQEDALRDFHKLVRSGKLPRVKYPVDVQRAIDVIESGKSFQFTFKSVPQSWNGYYDIPIPITNLLVANVFPGFPC